jgi:hypothetical protein
MRASLKRDANPSVGSEKSSEACGQKMPTEALSMVKATRNHVFSPAEQLTNHTISRIQIMEGGISTSRKCAGLGFERVSDREVFSNQHKGNILAQCGVGLKKRLWRDR